MGTFNEHINPQGYNLGGEPKNENPFFEFGGGGGGDITGLVRNVNLQTSGNIIGDASQTVNSDGTKNVNIELSVPTGGAVDPEEFAESHTDSLAKVLYNIYQRVCYSLIPNPTPDKRYKFRCGFYVDKLKYEASAEPIYGTTNIDGLGMGFGNVTSMGQTTTTHFSFDGFPPVSISKLSLMTDISGKNFEGILEYMYDPTNNYDHFCITVKTAPFTNRIISIEDPAGMTGSAYTEDVIELAIGFIHNRESGTIEVDTGEVTDFISIEQTKTGYFDLNDSLTQRSFKGTGCMTIHYGDSPSTYMICQGEWSPIDYEDWINDRTDTIDKFGFSFTLDKEVMQS